MGCVSCAAWPALDTNREFEIRRHRVGRDLAYDRRADQEKTGRQNGSE